MSKLQLSMSDMLNHFDPKFGLIIDLFAGGGGASEGIRAALGRDPDVAVNHDPEAISMHTMNHHDTMHFTADVFEVDPMTIEQKREYKRTYMKNYRKLHPTLSYQSVKKWRDDHPEENRKRRREEASKRRAKKKLNEVIL